MKKWALIETEYFHKKFSKLSPEIQERFKKQFKRIESGPYYIGKSIRAREWFREIKNDCFRAYYLIYDKQVIILLVGVSDKKSQQEVINFIIARFDEFGRIAESKVKK